MKVRVFQIMEAGSVIQADGHDFHRQAVNPPALRSLGHRAEARWGVRRGWYTVRRGRPGEVAPSDSPRFLANTARLRAFWGRFRGICQIRLLSGNVVPRNWPLSTPMSLRSGVHRSARDRDRYEIKTTAVTKLTQHDRMILATAAGCGAPTRASVDSPPEGPLSRQRVEGPDPVSLYIPNDRPMLDKILAERAWKSLLY